MAPERYANPPAAALTGRGYRRSGCDPVNAAVSSGGW